MHTVLLVTFSYCRLRNDLRATTPAANHGQARPPEGAPATPRRNSTNRAAGGMSLSQRNQFVTQFLPTKVRTTIKQSEPLRRVVLSIVKKVKQL